MKKFLIIFLLAGLFYGCEKVPTEELETLKSHINLMKKDKDSYVAEVVQDSLKSILQDIEYQKGKFVLFRSFKRIGVRLNNLNESIGNGAYRPEKFKIDQAYLEEHSSESTGEIKFRKLETGDFPALIYIVNIDGKEYIYSFRVYGSEFMITPKN